jgi:hypothetical protein
MLENTIHLDNEYWTKLKWPAAPNDYDYQIFSQYSTGRVLLLGSTKLLLPLCTEAWDLKPKYSDPKIKNKDWLDFDQQFDTVITDGGLVFGKELTAQLLEKVLPNCKTFVARTFLKPNWTPKYACYFPKAEELTPQPKEIIINEVYSFYIWNR